MSLSKLSIKNLCLSVVLSSTLGLSTVSCNDDDTVISYPVTITDNLPQQLPSDYTIESGNVTYTELNTGKQYQFELPATETTLPAGTYDVDGTMNVTFKNADGETQHRVLRTVARQLEISSTLAAASLDWFIVNLSDGLVFGEIYFAGSLNAAGTNGLYDTYFTIYNNTDSVKYADGLAIVESKINNTESLEILTAANQRDANFTVWTVYVIPGSGTDVAIQPGESIKIVDQAIDWSSQVAGALNHTDADFEWYDESTSATVKDTDNPEVPNLDKWFSYSPTIWVVSNQCNRSYALVKFPEGMTAEKFLAEQVGDYTYINAATGKEMSATKCYLIDYDWIIDGVNLCPTEGFIEGSLRASVDASYAAITEKKLDKARFGKKFVRRTAGVSESGNTILMDTNDSAKDFEVVAAE